MVDVIRTWRDFDLQIEQQTPQFTHLLNPPATEAEVTAVETHIGMSFPPSVRDSYLVHDGESEESDGLFDIWKFLPLSGVRMWWDEMKLIEETHHFGDFDVTSMIPIMFMEGDLRYVDDSVNGAETPLIEWNHEAPTRDEKATSFAAFLKRFLRDFIDGRLTAESEYNLKAIVERPS